MTIQNSKSYKLLVTTAIESTWGHDEELLFLGEWCKKFTRQNIYKNRSYQTLSYHWRDRKKLDYDHDYLEELYERMLIALAQHLNQIHNLERNPRYWRIFVGPWLLSYISVLWDRWESVLSLATLNEKELKAIRYETSREAPLDSEHHNELIGSDLWNYSIFNDILDFVKLENFSFIESKKHLNAPSCNLNNQKTSLKSKIRYFADLILIKLQKKSYSRYFFTKTYFPRKVLNKISYKLGFIAGFDSHFDKQINYNSPLKRSEARLDTFHKKNSFENFLVENILQDIPSAYVENFNTIYRIQKEYPDTKIIFTANAHFNNELFKLWAAEQTFRGAHLVVASHGGALYPLYSVFNHQELIADTRVVWGKEWINGQKRMPPNKLNFKITNYSKDGDITVIGYDTLRYSYRLISAPIGPLVIDSYEHSAQLISKINKEIKGAIKVRPQINGSHWETKKRYQSDFGDSIISKYKTMGEVFSKSKLVICTYPQTTLSESIFSGVPTLLYMRSDLWEIQETHKDLLKSMHKVKIFHEDPESAFRHIIEIYNNPIDWWQSDDVQTVIKEFQKVCLTDADDYVYEWSNFFKKLYDRNK